jgi:hypothetical protein
MPQNEFVDFDDAQLGSPDQLRTTGRSFLGHAVTGADISRFYREVIDGKWPDPVKRMQQEIYLHRAITQGGSRR